MYILECSNGQYYTGSTKDLGKRLAQHQAGEGANFTKKHLPVKLVYYEEFQRIDEAFYREKQVQGWSRKKKEALIEKRPEDLLLLSKNYTQYPREKIVSTDSNMVPSTSSEMVVSTSSEMVVSTSSEMVVSTSSTTEVTTGIQTVPELVEGTDNNRRNA